MEDSKVNVLAWLPLVLESGKVGEAVAAGPGRGAGGLGPNIRVGVFRFGDWVRCGVVFFRKIGRGGGGVGKLSPRVRLQSAGELPTRRNLCWESQVWTSRDSATRRLASAGFNLSQAARFSPPATWLEARLSMPPIVWRRSLFCLDLLLKDPVSSCSPTPVEISNN